MNSSVCYSTSGAARQQKYELRKIFHNMTVHIKIFQKGAKIPILKFVSYIVLSVMGSTGII